jgi:MYXO-CTERM domain-containing protein
MKASRLRIAVLGTLLVAACGTSSRGDAPKPAIGTTAPSHAAVAHRDPRLGLPTFAWISRAELPAFASAHEAVAGVTERVARAFELKGDMLATLADLDVDDASRGPIVARYRQRVNGIDVFRGGVAIAMTRAFEPIAASGLLAPSAEGGDRAFALEPHDAVAKAIAVVSGQAASRTLTPVGAAHEYERFAAAGLARPARAKKVLFPRRAAGDVELEPAYYVEVAIAKGPARGVVVSALDARVLFQNDLVKHDAYAYRVYADPTSMVPLDGPQGNGFAPHPYGKPDGTKLSYVEQQVVSLQNYPFSKNDPWLPSGATTTDGNNVIAYADLAAPTGFDAATDVRPALTDTATFGAAYDTAANPNATTAAVESSVQHLFYVTNFLHDWFYDAGFDEKSGNHQSDNFGRGGKGTDPLLAEAQDNSGRNNANAQVPADGDSPIIQMYVFSGPSNASLVVNAPAPIAGTKSTGIASGFGKDLFDTTADVVLAADGQGADLADACEPLTGDVTGRIVLAHRGTCSFAQKADNAQAAGAAGCIIANVASSTQPAIAPFMGGTQAGIAIPVLSLNLADGQALEQAIGAGANVTMHRSLGVDLDGGLDTSIVAHEWGHVLSGRLVGNGAGLTTNQAGGLGEGWGDFTALLLTVRADDPAGFAGTYANGSYATSGSGDDIYYGTRRVPYSIDFTKNALTFKHIQNGVVLPAGVPTSFGEDGSFNSEVHNTGEVWSTMLWECYAALLRDPRLSFAEAQARMKRYLVASLKLTPPDPTLLEARDAVLAAALAADEQDFKLFWQAFARRGAGAGATGPAKDSPSNGPVVESFFAGNDLQIAGAKLKDDVISCDHDDILDDGEVGTIELTLHNSGSGTITETLAKATSKTPGVSFEGGAETKLAPLKPFESTTLKIKTRIDGAMPVEPIELEVAFTDPSFEPGRTIAVKVPTYFDADEAPDASAVDHVDTKKTAWKATGTDTMGTSQDWARMTVGNETFWAIPNAAEASDHYLTSPRFTIDDKTFSLSFKHRYSFRISTRRAQDIDGGVVELSTDGKTWKDVSTYGAIDYNTTLSGGRGDNSLTGRKAYGNKSAGYPDKWNVSKVDVTLPEHPDFVQVRFRVSTGSGFRPADGWMVDDIQLDGISSTPFFAFVPHQDQCDPEGPSAYAGDSRSVPRRTHVTLNGSATSPKDLPLFFVWKQVEGPTVKLEHADSATPSFDAVYDPGTKLGFELRAHDGALLSPASRVDIAIDPIGPGDAATGSGCACTTGATPAPSVLGSGALAALAAAFVRRRRSRSSR